MASKAVTALGMTALFLGVGEIAARVAPVTPRVQVVDPDDVDGFEARDGTFTWHMDSPRINHDGCAAAAPDQPRVAFVGSSIFRGSGVSGAETFTTALQQRSDYCVANPSEPAFTAPQKRLAALDLLASERPPDLLFWEVWANDPGVWVEVGGTLWNAATLRRDATGHPNALGLPPALNAWLLDHSAMMRLLTWGTGADEGDGAGAFHALLASEVAPVVRAAEAAGTQMVLVVCPRLDRPFLQSASRPPTVYGRVWPFAEAHDLPWIRLALALRDEDVEALRVDTCCHFSAAGHARLAELFDAEIRERLGL